MVRSSPKLWWVLTLSVLTPVTGWAALVSVRCGNRWVSERASPGEVVDKCGEPVWVQTRHLVRRTYLDPQQEVDEEVEVQSWFYDFGPHALTQTLIFENGSLVAARSGGYGTLAGRSVPDAPRD